MEDFESVEHHVEAMKRNLSEYAQARRSYNIKDADYYFKRAARHAAIVAALRVEAELTL